MTPIQIRVKTGLTQRELAQVFGIHIVTWQRWEARSVVISKPVLAIFDDVLINGA